MITAYEAITVLMDWAEGKRQPSEALVALKQLLEMVTAEVQYIEEDAADY